MVTVLLTGMSGVGKSTVLKWLEKEGQLVVDLDYGDWIRCVSVDGNRWMDVRKMIKFMNKHKEHNVIFAGTAENQGEVYPFIDCVITLTAPIEVMRNRLIQRVDNPFGKNECEWRKIIRDKELFEPQLIKGSDIIISTVQPLEETVKEIRVLTGI